MSAVGVVDLGTGNLFSVLRGLGRAGAVSELVRTPAQIARAPRLVLPGVGSFADAARRAHALGLGPLLRDALAAKTPVLGICLGLHLLFDEGDEDGVSPGLGLLSGRVVRLRGGAGLCVPHVGWQRLSPVSPSALVEEGEHPWFYFSHSYRADARREDVCAAVTHGETIPAVVARGTLFGVQPHPEKSGEAGTRLLRRFLALEARP